MSQIRSMHSCATDARQAAREFYEGVIQPDTEVVVFFCSSEYDLDVLAEELQRLFGEIPVIGCTTAGEIGPAGYRERSLSGVSFPAAICTAVAGRIGELQNFSIAGGQVFAQLLLQSLERRAPNADATNTFAFLLIDGLSIREEPVTRSVQTALGNISLCGGSAGDDLQFSKTWVYHEGAFHGDSAVILLMSTELPFRVFKTQHFVSLAERLVVTEADTEHRTVKEINGLPAAEEYARLIGTRVETLQPTNFAAAPVVVLIDGTDYVRSIQKALPDGSLSFYCAIEEGLVLRVARGVDLAANLDKAFAGIREELGAPQAVLACDCILRKLEIAQNGSKPVVEALLRENNVVGFSTYGEQFGGVHVNQTFTGVAFGFPAEVERA